MFNKRRWFRGTQSRKMIEDKRRNGLKGGIYVGGGMFMIKRP